MHKALLALIAIFLTTPSVQAEGGFFRDFDIEYGVEIPNQIGIRTKFGFPAKWYSTVGVGFSLGPLVQMGTSIASGVGLVNSDDARFMDDALSNAFYIDLRGGYAFQEGKGFFIEFGYSLLTGGGKATTYETIEAVTRVFYTRASNLTINAEATLHNLQAHAGYKFLLSENWSLSLMGGLVKPLSTDTNLSFSDVYVDEQIMENDLTRIMDNVFANQMMMFTLGIWTSYNL